MWLAAIGLAVVVLGIGVFLPREWRDAQHSDHGWVSQRWLAEHRAGRG